MTWVFFYKLVCTGPLGKTKNNTDVKFCTLTHTPRSYPKPGFWFFSKKWPWGPLALKNCRVTWIFCISPRLHCLIFLFRILEPWFRSSFQLKVLVQSSVGTYFDAVWKTLGTLIGPIMLGIKYFKLSRAEKLQNLFENSYFGDFWLSLQVFSKFTKS